MKRTRILLAFAFLAFVSFGYVNAIGNTPTEVISFQQQEKLPEDVCQILCECSKSIGMSYEELVEKYWQNAITIEKIDVSIIRVTIKQEDGSPLIADIIGNF